jgi:phage gp46-like protein
LLQRSKQTGETLQKAYDYIAESLQWLIDDGVVGRFDINVQWVRASFLGAQITGYKEDGTQLIDGLYTWVWKGIS